MMGAGVRPVRSRREATTDGSAVQLGVGLCLYFTGAQTTEGRVVRVDLTSRSSPKAPAVYPGFTAVRPSAALVKVKIGSLCSASFVANVAETCPNSTRK